MRTIQMATMTATLMMWTHANAVTISVTNTNDSGAGSLRAALAGVAHGDTINFTVSVPAIIILTSRELRVTNSVHIIGPGPSNLAVNGNFISRVFNIAPSNTVTIANLTIAHGSVTNSYPDNNGGGIYNDNSTLTVSNCVFIGNSANSGGGILNNGSFDSSARLSVNNCTFSDNSAKSEGGGIFNNGGHDRRASLSIVSSTFSRNSAWVGGGIFNTGGSAGNATLTVSNSTFRGNVAKGYCGGGIFNDARGGGQADLTVVNSTFSNNSASCGSAIGIDGGIGGSATLTIGNTTLNGGGSGGTIFNDSGTVTSLGYNRSSDTNGPNDGRTDVLNTNPSPSLLVHSERPTNSHAQLPDSSVIVDISPKQTSRPVSAEEFDALVLSQGTSTDGFINRKMEATLLAALKAIRAKFPETANIHAGPSFALDGLAVGLTKQGQQIIERKVKMSSDSPKHAPITGDTGIRELDKLNAKYGATSVTAFYSTDLLLIDFKEPMDIPALRKSYAAIPEVQSADGDSTIGDGDEIHLKRDKQVWLFAFKHGWGDCLAGCIHKQYFFFSYHPDSQSVTKTGEYEGHLRDEEMWKKAEGGGKN